LKEEMEAGNFREDLFYRLNVIPIEVPLLRERVEDIPLLVNHFTKEFSIENNVREKEISQEALDILVEYDWPGNVRELKNVMERLVIMSPAKVIRRDDIPASIRKRSKADGNGLLFAHDSLKVAREEFEKQFIQEKLREFGDNISKTAEVIGIERSHLHRKIKNLGIEVER
ncbi:MAG: helix-turn-helix domain-containing protein, partial [Thermodesulfobacteriota bacterium]|nr:helix-turn-helix domain-containing protein [Thermodesulfobacteriota bacterium]